MRGCIGLLALSLGLSGCVGASQPSASNQDPEQRLVAERQACAERFGTKWVSRARCVNEAEDRTIKAQVRYLDLYGLRQAARVALAEKQEKKQITEAEARLQFAQTDAQIAGEAHRRENGARVAEAQESAAQAARVSNVLRSIEMSAPRPAVTCNTYGTMTACR